MTNSIGGFLRLLQSSFDLLLPSELRDVLEREILLDEVADVPRILQLDEVALQDLQHLILLLT